MCGIAGIISVRPMIAEHMMQVLHRMTDSIAHRGPEGEGFWMNGTAKVGLGHRRLKIIDLSDMAAQPMHGNNRFTLVFNGEIYNYRELKEKLIPIGYSFKTQSDTEVILAAYDCWREDCVSYFDGMFSFAIWDEKEQVLFCARDRFGEKPFYYSFADERLIFASEMKALWAAGLQKNIRQTPLLNYLALGIVQDLTKPDSTFFENIFSLPAAHYLKFSPVHNKIQVFHYWDIDKETIREPLTEKQAEEDLNNLLQESIRRRMRSDVPVGATISGGLDSSAIFAGMYDFAKTQSENSVLRTFSAVFPEFEQDESGFIRELNGKFASENFQITPDAGQLVIDFDHMMYHQEEPVQSLSIYAQYKVYELAKQRGVTVLLEGQGADEMLAGYHRYYAWYWQELYRYHPHLFKSEQLAAKKNGIDIPWNIRNKGAAFFPGAASRWLEKRARNTLSRQGSIDRCFYQEARDSRGVVKPEVRKLNDILYFNTCQLGLPELLRYADHNSMAHGREVRLPYLDHTLVQFIFSLPASYKIRDGWTKWILRKATHHRLPENITWRTDKIGFEPPQKQWLLDGRMKDKIMESRRKLVSNHILKPDVMQKPVQGESAHHPQNDDFRYLCAAAVMP